MLSSLKWFFEKIVTGNRFHHNNNNAAAERTIAINERCARELKFTIDSTSNNNTQKISAAVLSKRTHDGHPYYTTRDVYIPPSKQDARYNNVDTIITDKLFLTNYENINEKMNKFNATCCVVCGWEFSTIANDLRSKNKNIKFLSIVDACEENIYRHFLSTCKQIDNWIFKENKRVLIFCQYGISRSATITAAYLLYKYEYASVDDVLTELKTKRWCVRPNPGFCKQLEDFLKFVNTRSGKCLE